MATITGANVYPASFEGPDDGDGRDAASVLVGLEALADRTTYLKARLEGGGPVTISDLTVTGVAEFQSDVTVSSTLNAGILVGLTVNATMVSNAPAFVVPDRTITEAQQGLAAPVDGGDWALDFYGSPGAWVWATTSTAASQLVIPIDVPNGATISAVKARVAGQDIGRSLPANMPSLEVHRLNVAGTGAPSEVWSGSDLTGSTTVYRQVHDIDVPISPGHVVDRSTGRYFAVLTSESGTGALAGCQLHGLLVTYSYNRVDRT